MYMLYIRSLFRHFSSLSFSSPARFSSFAVVPSFLFLPLMDPISMLPSSLSDKLLWGHFVQDCSAAWLFGCLVGLLVEWWVGESLKRLLNLGPKAGEGKGGK